MFLFCYLVLIVRRSCVVDCRVWWRQRLVCWRRSHWRTRTTTRDAFHWRSHVSAG